MNHDKARLKKALIVEDDLAFIALVELALRDLDFEFDVARDGPTALHKLSQNRYHLVISDFRLPEIHGVDILRKAKKHNPDAQTVLITAANEDSLNIDIDSLGLLGFVQKPFSPIEFRDLITHAFQH